MDTNVVTEGTVTRFLPPAYDYVFGALVIVAVALTVVALVRLWRSQDDGPMSLLAFVAILALPIMGAGVYLYLSRRRRTLDRAPAASR